MKKEFMTVLEKFISFPTVDGKENEMVALLDYIKTLIPDGFYTKEYVFDHKPVLVITNTKEFDLDFVFCCHIDVVAHSSYQLIEDGDTLYGRGTFDMKGGTVAALLALFHQETSKKGGIFLTSDEELSGNCVKQLLEIYRPKFGIIPDGGNNFQLIKEEKGRLLLKVEIHTKSAHAAEVYHGENAILALMDAYNHLLQSYPLPKEENNWVSSVCLTDLKGGTALNQVPDYAVMHLDIRRIPSDSPDTFIDILKQANPNLVITVLQKETPYQTDLTSQEVKRFLTSAQEVLQKEIAISTSNATCDGIYFTEKKIPTVLMNPPGGNPHGEKEFVLKSGLFQLYEIYIQYLKNLEKEGLFYDSNKY